MTTQPEALRLADELWDWSEGPATALLTEQAADELRRLYKANQELISVMRSNRDLLAFMEGCSRNNLLNLAAEEVDKIDAVLAKHGDKT